MEPTIKNLKALSRSLDRIKGQVDSMIKALQSEGKDVTPIEEGKEFFQLQKEYSAQEIGRRIGKSGQYVRERIALSLADPILQKLATPKKEGGISLSLATALALRFSNHAEQRKWAKRALKSKEEWLAVMLELKQIKA